MCKGHGTIRCGVSLQGQRRLPPRVLPPTRFTMSDRHTANTSCQRAVMRRLQVRLTSAERCARWLLSLTSISAAFSCRIRRTHESRASRALLCRTPRCCCDLPEGKVRRKAVSRALRRPLQVVVVQCPEQNECERRCLGSDGGCAHRQGQMEELGSGVPSSAASSTLVQCVQRIFPHSGQLYESSCSSELASVSSSSDQAARRSSRKTFLPAVDST